MKADGGYGYKGSHIGYTATVLGRGRVASPTLGRLYPRRRFPVFIYKRLSGPQDESGQEGVNKNLHPSDSRDRTWIIQPVAKRPAASATRTTFVTVTSRYLNFSTFSNNKFPITVCWFYTTFWWRDVIIYLVYIGLLQKFSVRLWCKSVCDFLENKRPTWNLLISITSTIVATTSAFLKLS